jgi:hypothetical protein
VASPPKPPIEAPTPVGMTIATTKGGLKADDDETGKFIGLFY